MEFWDKGIVIKRKLTKGERQRNVVIIHEDNKFVTLFFPTKFVGWRGNSSGMTIKRGRLVAPKSGTVIEYSVGEGQYALWRYPGETKYQQARIYYYAKTRKALEDYYENSF
jgi:hypothetical protein